MSRYIYIVCVTLGPGRSDDAHQIHPYKDIYLTRDWEKAKKIYTEWRSTVNVIDSRWWGDSGTNYVGILTMEWSSQCQCYLPYIGCFDGYSAKNHVGVLGMKHFDNVPDESYDELDIPPDGDLLMVGEIGNISYWTGCRFFICPRNVIPYYEPSNTIFFECNLPLVMDESINTWKKTDGYDNYHPQ